MKNETLTRLLFLNFQKKENASAERLNVTRILKGKTSSCTILKNYKPR